MTNTKKMLLGFGVAVVAVAALWAGGVFNIKKSAPEPPVETAVFNSRFGFSLRYPKNWAVDTSKSQAPAEFIKEPKGEAFVAVQVLDDSRLKTMTKRAEVKRDIETSFKTDSQSRLEKFNWLKGKGENYSESYEAGGIFKDKQNKEWQFKETGILHGDGTIITLRSMAVKAQAQKYTKILDDIVYSFVPAAEITSAEAIEKVKNRPEVQKYISDLQKAGKQASFNAEDAEENWSVQVFEIVKQGGSSHTATFNWYTVNKKTGQVKAEFE